MTAGTDDTVGVEAREPGEPTPPEQGRVSGGGDPGVNPEAARPARIVLGLVGFVIVGWFMWNACLSFAYYPEWYADSKILIGLLALVVGVGGAYFLFYFLNMFVEGLPGRFLSEKAAKANKNILITDAEENQAGAGDDDVDDLLREYGLGDDPA